MSEFNFQTDVLERSFEVPVLVDFWAPWCGPCKVLGPILEELADEAEGAWQLVKIDTEIERDLATEYQIRSIPAVKLFFRGEQIAQFMGALPKGQIENWLRQHLPDERKAAFAEIEAAVAADPAAALPDLRAFAAAHPDFRPAALLLAQHTVLQAPEAARALVANIRLGDKEFEEAEQIRVLAGLLTFDTSEEGTVPLKVKAAREALQSGDAEAAIQSLIEAVMLDKSFHDDLPRKACIALFQHLGPDHPVTRQYRRRFDMALY